MRYGKEISNDLWRHGYKIKIYPDEEQKKFLDRCIDVCRFMYNWTIEQEEKQYKLFLDGKSDKRHLTFYDFSIEYTKLRKELDFLNNIPVCSGRSGILRAIKAYDKYFKKKARRPKFKSKKRYSKVSFNTRAERMYFEDNMLKIEGLDTLIYTKYHSGFDKNFRQFKEATISRDNIGNYYISYTLIEKKPLEYFEDNNIKPLNRAIGIDLNVKKRFVLSTEEIFYGPDLSRELEKLKIRQSRVSRDIKRQKKMERTNPSKNCQSKRARKRQIQLQKQYKRITNITENFIQQTTKKIIDMNPSAVVMENLEVNKTKQKNHFIASNLHHAKFYRCIEVMEYKCDKYNIPFIKAAKDYPSSQICSCCGNRQEIKLWNKKYKCKNCGLILDRDINAALNLEKLAYC